MILGLYTAARHHFAEVARSSAVSLTYNAGPPSTITRASGSFVADGHLAGHTVQVIGTASNDGRYEVDTVAALTITLVDTMTGGETVTSSLVGAFYENDGMEQWPLANVRAGGFDDGFATVPANTIPLTPFPLTLTVNAEATDVSAGTSYTWWLSQRTETAASQHFTMTHADSLKTGTVTLALTATAVSDLGLDSATDALNVGARMKAFRNVYVYCQRDSDKAIQLVHLLALSDAQPV
jgi:hypothetical protein